MKIKFRVLRRLGYTMTATALLVGAVIPALAPAFASAVQLSSRSITLSDSGASGGSITSGVGSGTGVTYGVSFTTTTTAQSLIIDFCSNDPIIGDTCTAPTGMNASTPGLTGVTGNISSPGWNVTGSASQIELAKGSGSSATAGVQNFNLTGITNPSGVGSFYARIYTYGDTTFGSTTTVYTSATVLGDFKDYGGIALSTNQVITITARVQESLTFCVSGADTSTWTGPHDCSSSEASTAPAVTLGHGSLTKILDTSAVDTGQVFSQLSTNATHGAVIALRNSNLSCGGLSADGGTTCGIPAVGGGSAHTITAGTAAFGLNVGTAVNDPGGTANSTGASNFSSPALYGTASDYGMDPTNVTSTFGDTVESTTAPCFRVDTPYTFAATAGLTTPAGIYTANLALIATGTF